MRMSLVRAICEDVSSAGVSFQDLWVFLNTVWLQNPIVPLECGTSHRL